jgi:hypothetical protein
MLPQSPWSSPKVLLKEKDTNLAGQWTKTLKVTFATSTKQVNSMDPLELTLLSTDSTRKMMMPLKVRLNLFKVEAETDKKVTEMENKEAKVAKEAEMVKVNAPEVKKEKNAD